MRLLRVLPLALLLLPACGGGDDDDDDDVGNGDGGGGSDADVLPANSFQLVTSDLTIEAGDERTHCYYTTVPVDRAVGVKRWSSSMTQGSHHMIMYALSSSSHPDGTVEEDCSVLGGDLSGVPAWTFSAQTPTAEFDMPADVGMTLAANQKVVIEMHYLNTSSEPIQAHVELIGEYYASDVEYTPASAFITYDTSIEIEPHADGEAGGACDVPAGKKFFAMSTHVHKRGTLTRVTDGADAMVFESDDWESPGSQLWMSEPFYEFGDKLTYRCEYFNDLDVEVRQGPSAETDEMCMAVGYFFPATAPTFCINNSVIDL